MKKLNQIEYNKDELDINKLFVTEYDELFKSQIRSRGIHYYSEHKVTDIHKSKNKIKAVINGTENYNVSIEYLDNNELEVKCTCPYHKETDIYCKHVYALLITLKMIYQKEKFVNLYKSNINKIKDIKASMKQIVIDNKKYFDVFIYSWGCNLQDFYEKYLNEMDNRFDKNNVYKLVNVVKDSFYHLNHVIDDYNEVLDRIEEGKQELERRKNEKDVITHTYTIDDSGIFDAVDDTLANIDLSILERIRQENIKSGESTEIIEKAIAEKKRRNEIIRREHEEREIIEKREQKSYRRALFFGFLSGLFSNSNNDKSLSDTDYLMPWEKDLVDKREYEPYQFEEEELEEDDYYYEDD